MSVSNIISQKTKEEFEQIAKELIDIKKDLRIGTTSLTPTNFADEMEKFLKSDTYNPVFTYTEKQLPDIENVLEGFKKRAEKLSLPEDIKEHFLEYLDDQKMLFLTKKNIGKEKFSDYAHSLFDWGTDRLDVILAATPKNNFQLHYKHNMQHSNKIKERFEKVLKSYGIDSFHVEINSFTSHMINAGYKKISIGNEIKRYECNVDRLIVHEIESHVIQTENMKRTNSPLVELYKYGNMNLYSEGLAVYNEIMTKKITPSAYEMYFNRIKAVRLLHKSFREIFETLVKDLPMYRAYIMTYRVKRGLRETKEAGGFPKDASYLLGFHEIETLVNEGFSKRQLYITKSPVLTSLLLKYELVDDKNIITPRFLK